LLITILSISTIVNQKLAKLTTINVTTEMMPKVK